MSVTSQDDRTTSYSPIVATTDFAAGFPVFALTDLAVYVDGVERFDFTVSGSFTDGISTNAKAVFSPGIVGQVLVVGSRDPHRTSRFTNGAPLPVKDQNLALDTIEAEVQEAARDIKRSLKVPPGSTGYSVAAGIAPGALLVMGDDGIEEGPAYSGIADSVSDAQAAAAAAALSAQASEASKVQSGVSAASSSSSANASAVSQAAAQALVVQATAGFAGFLDGQGYDFGLISDATTYFNQDWGSV